MVGLSSRYLAMGAINGDALTITGTAAVSSVADILGDTTAGEYDFGAIGAGTLLSFLPSGVGSIAAGDVIWTGFYLKSASSQAMEKVLCDIRYTPTGGSSIASQYEIPVTSEARLTLIPTPVKHTITGFSLNFLSEAHVELGVKDKIIIDRPHAYRSSHPVPHDVFRAKAVDADYTLLPHYAGMVHIRQTTALTANRTISLGTTGGIPGVTRFRIQRASTATGAFNLVIGATGVNLTSANTFADVVMNAAGTGYVVEAKGVIV